MIIEAIRNYFLDCPVLKPGALNIDYMAKDPVNYSIDTIPTTPILKKYTDGASLKQYTFSLNVNEEYSSSYKNNLENLGFYEKLEEWITEKNKKNELPDLDNSRSSMKLEVLTGGYLFIAEDNTAVYQMQLRLVYYEQN